MMNWDKKSPARFVSIDIKMYIYNLEKLAVVVCMEQHYDDPPWERDWQCCVCISRCGMYDPLLAAVDPGKIHN